MSRTLGRSARSFGRPPACAFPRGAIATLHVVVMASYSFQRLLLAMTMTIGILMATLGNARVSGRPVGRLRERALNLRVSMQASKTFPIFEMAK